MEYYLHRRDENRDWIYTMISRKLQLEPHCSAMNTLDYKTRSNKW